MSRWTFEMPGDNDANRSRYRAVRDERGSSGWLVIVRRITVEAKSKPDAQRAALRRMRKDAKGRGLLWITKAHMLRLVTRHG